MSLPFSQNARLAFASRCPSPCGAAALENCLATVTERSAFSFVASRRGFRQTITSRPSNLQPLRSVEPCGTLSASQPSGRGCITRGRHVRHASFGNKVAPPPRRALISPRSALFITSSAGICGGGIWYYWNTRSKSIGALPTTTPASPIEKPALFAAADFTEIAVASKTNTRMLHVIRLKPEHINAKLRRNESSISVAADNFASAENALRSTPTVAVSRWDVAQVNSNEPVEDAHAEFVVVDQNTANAKAVSADTHPAKRYIWGIFDGHSGFHCSQKVAAALPLYCAAALEKADSLKISAASEKPLICSEALQSAFLALDEEIVRGGLISMASDPGRASEFLLPAVSGSCALIAHLDVATQDLYVAWAGDSRAVLGRQDEVGKVTAVQLSWDQTGRDPSEIKRIRAEHPGEEETAVYRGRVLGNLEPTRSFGDARYKWDIKTSKMIFGTYYNREIPRHYRTPPYVTARPAVTHHRLTVDDKFLVLATDGLYDELTNDEIVALVTGWMRRHGKFPSGPAGPLETGRDPRSKHPQPSIPTAASDRRWTYVDDNVATHLIRNALGGADTDTLAQVLSVPPPYSRRFRDDITVTVVFFDNVSGGQAGNVTEPGVKKILIGKDGSVRAEEGNGIPNAKL